jgi:hypothetical protein
MPNSTVTRYRNKIRMVLLAMALYSLAGGIFDGLLYARRYGPPPLLFVHGIVMAILIYAWVKLHAKSRGVPEKAFAGFAALFPPLGVPFYLFRAFGGKGGLIGTLKAFGFYLVLGVLYTKPLELLSGRSMSP